MDLELLKRLAEVETKSKNPTPTIVPMPLYMQIEFNITGWKGYEGINIQRDTNNENSWDIQKELLSMDTLDGKIGFLSSATYRKEIAMREKLQDFKEMEFWYK